MKPGDRLTLHVDRPAAGGRMIARHEGTVVFVAAAIPGETVDVVVERVQKGTAWASTERVLDPSPDRVEDAVDLTCGGNVLAHIRGERQRAIKLDIVRDAFTRIGRLPLPATVPVASSPLEGYRMRARLHLQGGRLGFYREGTHALCDPAVTRQLLPATLDVVREMETVLRLVPAGVISEVALSENAGASERAAHLELAAGADPSRLGSLPAIAGLLGLSCAGPRQARALTLWGTPRVTETIALDRDGGVALHLSRHARAFFQGNRYLLQDLVAAVVAAAGGGRILDLYAGVGLFAVALALARGAEVIAVEGDRTSAEDLKHNAAQTAGAVAARHQAVETYLATATPPRVDAIVIDPPRSGLSKEAMAGVIACNATHLVYVSCDVATLARDSRILVDRGYHLKSLHVFDLFPCTAHVESLAVFVR